MNSDTLVKRVLEKAYIVLDKLQNTHSKPVNVDQAKASIAATLQDKRITQAAQELEYDTLCKELQSFQYRITEADLDGANEIRGKRR